MGGLKKPARVALIGLGNENATKAAYTIDDLTGKKQKQQKRML